MAEPRRFGADAAWADEKAYCRASRALRFPELRKVAIGTEGAKRKVAVAFRRLFSDGVVVTRVEVGLVDLAASAAKSPIDAVSLLSMAQGVLQLRSHVPFTGPPIKTEMLALQGSTLARLLTRATTKAQAHANPATAAATPAHLARGVEDGNPLLIVEQSAEEWSGPPSNFSTIDKAHVGGANLAFGWISPGPNLAVGTWILSQGEANAESLRALRLCLLRLHAEQEVLATVLAQLRRGWILDEVGEEAAKDLDSYLNGATRLINKSYRNGVKQSALLDAYYAADTVTPPADQALLVERHEWAHERVWRKVQEFARIREQTRLVNLTYVQGDQTVTNQGNIIGSTLINSDVTNAIAKQITDSFKKTVGTLDDKDEKKQALTALHDAVQQLNDTLSKAPPAGTDVKAEQEKVAANFDTLAQQAAAPKPLPSVLQVTGQGLIDAAKTVAEMVGPITIAVKGVLALFGVVLP